MNLLNYSKVSTTTVVACVFVMYTSCNAKGNPMNAEDLILIPDPTISRFVFGGYDLEKDATVNHYNELFDGKTAREVVLYFEEEGQHVSYFEDPNKISIILERFVLFFYYRVGISFTFEDGVFEKSEIWASGIK